MFRLRNENYTLVNLWLMGEMRDRKKVINDCMKLCTHNA